MRKKSLIIAIFIIIYDQLIKNVINNTFYYGKLKCVINNFFYLTKVYNDGAAWSTFAGNRYFLIIISILALLFLIWYQKNFPKNRVIAISFGLIYGGLIGNLIDRIRYGYVIDYFKIVLGSYEFPIFNLADVTIVIGFLIVIFNVFKGEDKYGNKSSRK